MLRGSTPTIRFTLPFSFSMLAELWLTVSQNDREVFTVKKERLTASGDQVSCKLTQEETLKLRHEQPAAFQVRWKTNAGDSGGSKIKTVSVEKILKDGVI